MAYNIGINKRSSLIIETAPSAEAALRRHPHEMPEKKKKRSGSMYIYRPAGACGVCSRQHQYHNVLMPKAPRS